MEIFNELFTRLLIESSAICLPVVELIKRLLHLQGIAAVVLSLLVSIMVGVPFALANHLTGFTMAVLVGATWAVINGWYKVPKKGG